MSQQSLKDKTIKGTAWSAADAILGQGITFLVGLVLARLLSPEEYGLIGICMIFISVLNGIVDSGFSNALIRKNNASDTDYNTMFIANMLASVFLYIVLFLASSWISVFFDRSELTSLIRVVGLILFANALSITQNTILTKRIDFKTKTKASVVSSLISGIIGVIMALSNFGVWSLVGQVLSKQITYTFCLWILNHWWPTFTFSSKSFYYMWGFGWKLMVSGLLNTLWNQLYQVVVGKFYSPFTLGQYTRGREYAGLLSSNLTTIIQRVSFPVLCQLQDDKSRMVEGYRKVIKMTMFVSVLGLFTLGAISEPLLYCMIGPQWYEASTYLPLICILMTLYPLHAINLNMLQVLGRSDIFLYLEIIKKIIGLFPLIVGIYIGIYWMLVSSIFISIISLFLNSWYTGKKLNYGMIEQIKDISHIYLIAISISIPVYLLKYVDLSYWYILPVQITIALLGYVIISEYIKLSEYIEIKKLLCTFRLNNTRH